MSEAQLFVATSFTETYERVLVGPLFRPFAEQLVSRLQPRRGDSVIDVACGTGIVARIARERLGPDARIVGVDRAPSMLAVARAVDATIDWRLGDAVALPVPAGEQFTLVTCHQALQFMPERDAAVREMRRVAAPGGRVGIATWRAIEEVPLMLQLNGIVERHVGKVHDTRHGLGDDRVLYDLLIHAGFTDVRVETVSHDVRFADGGLFARLNAMAAIGMSEQGRTMPEAERSQLAAQVAVESRDVIAKASASGTFVLPFATNLATAQV